MASSSFVSSFPILHLIVGSFFVTKRMVFFRLSQSCFMLEAGVRTLPIFGFGIFPFGPRYLPNTIATFGIMEDCAIKKSYLFASFFASALLLNLSNWSIVIVSLQASLAFGAKS